MMTNATGTRDSCQVARSGTGSQPATHHASRVTCFAFSMVELLVAMTLLSLIVLVLMTVFNSTQAAFRSSVTQTDILEGSRATMDLMTTDLRTMVPADGNYLTNGNFYAGSVISSNAVNFFALDNSYASCSYLNGSLGYEPLPQTLPASSLARSNVLEYFFFVGKVNTKWTGVGYVVNATNTAPLYPLYRFYAETNISISPVSLYWAFVTAVNQSQWTNMSHVQDGVVHMALRPYNANGIWMTNRIQWANSQWVTNNGVWFMSPPHAGEVGFFAFTNMVPAAVELQLGVLEDRALQRAESLGIAGTPPMHVQAQWNYLKNQAGHVQIFRQRVTIPNVDFTAYQ